MKNWQSKINICVLGTLMTFSAVAQVNTRPNLGTPSSDPRYENPKAGKKATDKSFNQLLHGGLKEESPLKLKDFKKTDLQRALEGGIHGGGGNAQSSTREDLEEIVSSMNRHVWEISDRFLVGGKIELTSRPLKKDLSEMTQNILGISFFTINDSIYEYIKNLKYEISEGPCMHGQEPSDASTKYQKNAPICLSASRLARFPKSALKQVVLSLIFHEIAHQFGYGEKEAQAFQSLAALHLKYRPIYLSSVRARFQCALASESLTTAQKRETLEDFAKIWGQTYNSFPVVTGAAKTSNLVACAVRSASAGENLVRFYDGDLWAPQEASTLSREEKQILINYHVQNQFSFLTMIRALNDPAIISDCRNCQKDKVDPALLMMLGAKTAMDHIDHEVGRQQDLIRF